MSASSPAEVWHGLLRPDVELAPAFWNELSATMRAAKLTFGDRVHCPFLRPIFLDPRDVSRVAQVAETLADVGERVVQASLQDASILDAVGLTDAERPLFAIEPGYARASTASRLDGFLLSDSLWFAEYNAESPAGFGYTERLAAVFDALPIMARFRERFSAEYFRLTDRMLDALVASYRDWGGTASPPTILIVDFHGVPTWTEFEILQARFEQLGVPTVVADPHDMSYEGGRLTVAGRNIDLVYRRALFNDVLAHPDACRPLVEAYRARTVCMANTFRCKVPHKKAFFAVLTDERFRHLFTPSERDLMAAHIPWTRLVADRTTELDGRAIDLLAHVLAHREEFVVKPNDEYGGAGVVLGWEVDSSTWQAALDRAVAERGAWVVQRRIPVRREVFPIVDASQGVSMRDMLVDLAPYLFRGKVAGFLTRLSSTGLANVTSGGGQVPAFVVTPRES